MPFDGTGYESHETLDKMDQVIGLLSDEQRWCKGELRSSDGRYCILGAIKAVYAEGELKAPILLAIEQVTGHSYVYVEQFNDHALTTHALVTKVLQQARENIFMAGPAAPKQSVRLRARLWSIFC